MVHGTSNVFTCCSYNRHFLFPNTRFNVFSYDTNVILLHIFTLGSEGCSPKSGFKLPETYLTTCGFFLLYNVML